MKTLKAIRDFDWRTVWGATKILSAVVGGIAMIAFTANQRTWMLTFTLLAIACMWGLIFALLCCLRARSEFRCKPQASLKGATKTGRESKLSRSVDPSTIPQAREKDQIMRRRFVFFDPEKGEEVYKMEPVA
jgi:hypothetical protein